MSEPDFQAEIVGYQVVVDDQGTVLLLLRLHGGATVGWPMSVRMAADLSSDLREAVASAIEMGRLCPDCLRRHDRRERPDADVQLPLNFDAALKQMMTEESGDEH